MKWQKPQRYVLLRARKELLALTPPQALLFSYVMLILAGTLLLKLPAAANQPTSWMQALFTAVSASTITGLGVVDTGTHFSQFGHVVLMILMQLGGLGLLTFGILFIHLSSGQLTLRHRAALSEALNQVGQADMRRLLLWMFGFTVGMELLGAALLSLHWIPEKGLLPGIMHSLFHSISAYNNAGFALASDSLSGYVANPLINLVITLLIISGSIGFVVIVDLFQTRRFRDYALHTKLMLIGTVAINLVAMALFLWLEYGNPATLGALPGLEPKLWASWFQAVTPRTAGFNTIDIGALLPASTFLMMVLMFIGAGSGSTGGGIKLSTFLVLLLATRTFLRQQERTVVFGRSIASNVVLKALAIVCISLLLLATGIFLLTITETAPFIDLAFEAVSALATVGLSRGITADLSYAGQVNIMLLMLIGRVGPLTLAFTIANRRPDRIQYPAGRVNVG